MDTTANSHPSNSPTHIGMDGPTNQFTADEINVLMGLIPNEQQTAATSFTENQGHSISSTYIENSLLVDAAAHPSTTVSSEMGSNGRESSASSASSTTKTSNGIDAGSKNQARSERKRCREKQRRTDVNKQFGELTEVLKRIEAEQQQLQQERVAREECRDNDGGTRQSAATSSRMILPPFSPTNRIDLIARTIAHLERLSHLTKKQAVEIQTLGEELKSAKKAGEDTAQKLKEAVFNHQPQTGMMAGMMGMGGNAMFNPMGMAMAMANPMSMAGGSGSTTSNGMMSIQPQKQQLMPMMMMPIMMPPQGSSGTAIQGSSGMPMMQPGNHPFMMMPQVVFPSQQQQTAPSSSQHGTPASSNDASTSSSVPATSTTNSGTPAPSVAPSPISQQQQLIQNQQAMMMQQAMMLQSMQPMFQQMPMMQQPLQPQNTAGQVMQQQPPTQMFSPPVTTPTSAGIIGSQQQPSTQSSSMMANNFNTAASSAQQQPQEKQDTESQRESNGADSYAYAA